MNEPSLHLEPSPNFAFLAYHDTRLVALGTQAEQHFTTDPNVTLYKLRQFGEVLAKRACAIVGILHDPRADQHALIEALWDRSAIGALQRDLFHQLRRTGNRAVHDFANNQSEALHQLRVAHQLAIWFQRSFGNSRKFDPGPFVPPSEPRHAEPALREQLERLRQDAEAGAERLAAAEREREEARRAAEAEAERRLTAEERAAKAAEEAAIWAALAAEQAEAEAQRTRDLEELNRKLQAELERLQAQAQAQPAATLAATVERAAQASQAIVLDEAGTRRLIDEQLRAAGWEAGSEHLTFAQGARPTKGKNLAIAEWPTSARGRPGRADYVLFAGLTVVATVEAKAAHKDVCGVIPQAQRYSEGYVVQGDETLPEGSPWGKHQVPFVFATNGRPYLRQLKTKSGIWFLDVRRRQNHPVALEGWYTPDGLLELLKRDIDEANQKLEVEPMPYIDRDYQRQAILAVERGIRDGQRELLVAMATGTGKTRTCIGLCYRLLKSRRFRRVLFLVDRSALGKQTADALKDLRLENLQTFTDIFDVKELGDLKPDPETRLHIATIQAMVKRVLGPFEDYGTSLPAIPPVDQYDCIVVDECHRGYLLDRELSDGEFQFRDQNDYISKYRRVLDHFDAVKIGLTATPALHTTEIFGKPIYQYSYREAVVDGFLVDHEPPFQIITQLAQDGIHYQARQQVLVFDPATKSVNKEELPDELDFEVEAFNRRVITENFNRAVIGELVKHLDPLQDEKTLIFCATDSHADMVVTLLKEELDQSYDSVDDDLVAKITGSVDRPLELIRKYRNERHPNIVVTVDLLTTGIDVPRIANLVFLRRVSSRILYEQMLGRATRLCPEIGKERFRIFDAVDLYSAIQDVTDMKPVAIKPFVTFEQLAKEIVESKDDDHRAQAITEFLAKLQRKKRKLPAETQEQLETAASMPLQSVVDLLRRGQPTEVADWLGSHGAVARALDSATSGTPYKPIVSDHVDFVRDVRRGYGTGSRPEDYLDAFRRHLEQNLNSLPALLVVTQRPRDLKREDLKQLKLALDQAGFTEAALQTAWRESKNEDIAATIVGYIRRLALGSPLVPYAERVERAVQQLRRAHRFTDPQRKWLDRIATQIKFETVVDRDSLDQRQFKAEGGFKRLNKVFEGQLESLLGELAEAVWQDAGCATMAPGPTSRSEELSKPRDRLHQPILTQSVQDLGDAPGRVLERRGLLRNRRANRARGEVDQVQDELVRMLRFHGVRAEALIREVSQVRRHDHLRPGSDCRREDMPVVRIRKSETRDQAFMTGDQNVGDRSVHQLARPLE